MDKLIRTFDVNDDPSTPASLVIGCCEDDPAISRLLAECLARAGHRGRFTRSGAEAMHQFQHATDIDALVLDIGLPDIDGRDLCRALRASGQRAPVMFLSALGDVHDVVQGFTSGGLDYVVKPFAVPELLARIAALVRRTEPSPASRDLRVDPEQFALCYGENCLQLTPTEFRIAAELLAHAGRLVLREDLISAGWVPGAQVNQNTLDTYLYRLRQHILKLGSSMTLKTVRGVGYILQSTSADKLNPSAPPGRNRAHDLPSRSLVSRP